MKSRMVAVTLLLGSLGMCGCFSEDYLTGNTKYRAIRMDTLLRKEENIGSKHIERLEVRYKNKYGGKRKFDALIGPYPYTGAVSPAEAWYNNPVGRIVSGAGWVYAYGECPYVETTLVEATAHGSNAAIISQIDGAKHRIYLLNITGHEVATVTKVGFAPVSWNASQFTGHSYVEAQAVGDLSPPAPVSGGGVDIIEFVQYVIDQAEAAEVPPH